MNATLPMSAPRYTLVEIAEALGKSRSAVTERARKDAWAFVEEGVIGGKKRFYPLATLPKEIRETVQLWAVKRAMATLPAEVVAALPAAPAPKITLPAVRKPIAVDVADARQLLVRDARLALLNAIRGAVDSHEMSESKAIDSWLASIVDDSMPVAQQLWCAIAHDKSGFVWEVTYAAGGPSATPIAGQVIGHFAAKLSKRSVQRWIAERREGGDDVLIPGKRTKDMSVPGWAGFFLAEMQRPQKPTKQAAYDKMAAKLNGLGWSVHNGSKACGLAEYPDYSTVCRWYKDKYSKLDAHKGRNTGSAMNPFKFAHKRTSDGMWPLLEVHSDGWATKFTAPHPVSGKFVTYEVWHSHDVATRKAYVHERSIGLSENMMVILGSLYAVCAEDGEPVVWQTDNTGSVKNDRVEFDPSASIAARRGMTIVHNLPGNSQANGIAESFNRYLYERSKDLATFQGREMDSLAAKRTLRITQAMVRAMQAADAAEVARLRAEAQKTGCGMVFGSYGEAVAWLKKIVVEFNDMPHRELPKIADAESGKRRHMTPNERMADFVADGWEKKPLSGDELIDAFRVHEVKRVTRGVVSVMGQTYHHDELDHLNGEDVLVAYDIEDGLQVYIKRLDGVPMCTAKFYESRNYRPMSFYDIALEKRADMQIKRHGKHIAEIEAQRPTTLLENVAGERLEFGMGPAIESEAVRIAEPVEPNAAAKPNLIQMEDTTLVRWLAKHPEDWNDNFRSYLAEQADKIKPLARLINELDLWDEIDKADAGNAGDFKKRAVGS